MQIPANIQTAAHVGLALSAWSQVEMEMTALFFTLSGMDQARTLAVYDGIISFEVRLAILDRLMQVETLDELEREMWGRLSARLTDHYKKRHQVAHFRFVGVGPNEMGISSFLTYDKLINGKEIKLTRAQINERTNKFVELEHAICWFKLHAAWRRKQVEPTAQQAVSEPPLVTRLRELAVLNLARKRQQPRRDPSGAEEE